jgi:hypothetical protein
LDSVIEANPADPQAPIATVFAEVASVHPDLWQVLRDHACHPALAEGSARFRRSVLAGTGVDPVALMPGCSPRDITVIMPRGGRRDGVKIWAADPLLPGSPAAPGAAALAWIQSVAPDAHARARAVWEAVAAVVR